MALSPPSLIVSYIREQTMLYLLSIVLVMLNSHLYFASTLIPADHPFHAIPVLAKEHHHGGFVERMDARPPIC